MMTVFALFSHMTVFLKLYPFDIVLDLLHVFV